MQEAITNSDEENKAARLIDYLIAVASLRSKVVRTVDQYDRVLWMDEIPDEKECFCKAKPSSTEPSDDDVWLEIQIGNEPEVPTPPAKCVDWIDRRTLKTGPKLKEQIRVEVENPEFEEGNGEPETTFISKYLSDYPDVRKTFDSYVNHTWTNWWFEHERWKTVHATYSQLFTIYKELQKLGEEYELVVGLGLFTWDKAKQGKTRRHLIVCDAQIQFESHLAKFTVKAATDGAKVRTELEILDSTEQSIEDEEIYREQIEASGDDPWNTSQLFTVLTSIARSINSACEFKEVLTPPEKSSDVPIVNYAPALILRKRSKRGMTETLGKIKEIVLEGGDLPSEFKELAEIETDKSNWNNGDDDRPYDSGRRGLFDGEIFFPKLSNKEQRQIVEKLKHKNSLLVQGPPGTGKSHTIANLICHLLATGQRTLITAKTPRALKVLEAQLPEDLRSLAINLLGSGLDEQKSLEASIGGILNQRANWIPSDADREIEKLTKLIDVSRRELMTTNRQLTSIRESETHKHELADGAYRGTAAQIARQVRKDANSYIWFNDRVPINEQFSIELSQLMKALSELRYFNSAKRKELTLHCPRPPLTAEEFSDLVGEECLCKEKVERLSKDVDSSDVHLLAELVDLDFDNICLVHEKYSQSIDALAGQREHWVEEMRNDVLANRAGKWSELLSSTDELLTKVHESSEAVENNIVDNPSGHALQILYTNVSAICNYLEGGGKLRWSPFNSKEIKPHLKVLKEVRINGHECKTKNQFKVLKDTLNVEMLQKKLFEQWEYTKTLQNEQAPFRLRKIKDSAAAIRAALSLQEQKQACENEMQKHPHLKKLDYTQAINLHTFLKACNLTKAIKEENRITSKLASAEQSLQTARNTNQIHPDAHELLKAIKLRDPLSYSNCHQKIKQLSEDQRRLEVLNSSLETLKQKLPIFVDRLEKDPYDEKLETRISNLENAWKWRQANDWLNDYIRGADAYILETKVKRLEDEINKLISKSASYRAWKRCFERLTDGHERSMQAWQQSMKRLGKGTGKHAPKHRKEAQRHLNDCKEAVPAWIMPLHRIWDTISPEAGMFDVIIVDEASQCGLEGLPLTFLAKKLLIVGDDKQISPEAVGYDQSEVDQLKNKYLKDFSLRSTFDAQSSLFEHANIRFGSGRITLREHFRCMPEIIRFSNDLCYSETPLIPLRQYSPNRLQPTRHIMVNDGYREGSHSRVINRPEAEQIVETIAELVEDERYEGKTFGVISLQGDAQSELIENLLLSRIGAEEIESRKLVCGNAYSFQGDERDVVFLSMVAAPNERIGPFTRPADQQRFNVAASRARDQLLLFHSVSTSDLSENCLRRKLLHFFQDTSPPDIAGIQTHTLEAIAANADRNIESPPSPFDSWFEVDVALEISRKGYEVIPQYEVGSKRIDLVVEGGQARLAVECDGDHWHGTDEYEHDMQRQRQLERAQWEFYRIRESMFYANRNEAMKKLWPLLEARGILPKAKVFEEENEELDAIVESKPHKESEASALKPSQNGVEKINDPEAKKVQPAQASRKNRLQDLTAPEIQEALMHALKKCPNNSCTLKSAPKNTLRELGIITRGKPLKDFTRRLMTNAHAMEKAGKVEIYKATNERIRISRDLML